MYGCSVACLSAGIAATPARCSTLAARLGEAWKHQAEGERSRGVSEMVDGCVWIGDKDSSRACLLNPNRGGAGLISLNLAYPNWATLTRAQCSAIAAESLTTAILHAEPPLCEPQLLNCLVPAWYCTDCTHQHCRPTPARCLVVGFSA